MRKYSEATKKYLFEKQFHDGRQNYLRTGHWNISDGYDNKHKERVKLDAEWEAYKRSFLGNTSEEQNHPGPKSEVYASVSRYMSG